MLRALFFKGTATGPTQVNIQFKVNKVEMQLGSLELIEQLYPPMYTLSGARQVLCKMMRLHHGKLLIAEL